MSLGYISMSGFIIRYFAARFRKVEKRNDLDDDNQNIL